MQRLQDLYRRSYKPFAEPARGPQACGAHSADRDHPDRVMVIAQIGNVIAESERSDVVLSGCGC